MNSTGENSEVCAPTCWGLALLIWFCAVISIGLQTWIGDASIYSEKLEMRREALHFGILENSPPGGKGWGAVGGLTIQKRVGVVFLAEGVRRITGLSVGKVYKALDTAFLFMTLMALFFYLKRWVSPTLSVIGLLYFSAMLPFTYQFQLFHPWDRPQLLLWLGLLYLCFERRFWLLIMVLPIAMLVKYDLVVLPAFYLLLHIVGQSRLRAITEAAALLVVASACYLALDTMFPAPLDKSGFNLKSALDVLAANLQMIASMGLRLPPLIVLGLPLLLVVPHWKKIGWEMCASLLFAVALLVTFVSFSKFEEVRAQMVVLVLLLPAALQGLDRLLSTKEAPRFQTSTMALR